MKPEIRKLVEDLKNSNASFYQAGKVISEVEDLSVDEKRNILKCFLPEDALLHPDQYSLEPKSGADTISDAARRFLSFFTKEVISKIVFWGLAFFFSYYALWAISRWLERLIMKI